MKTSAKGTHFILTLVLSEKLLLSLALQMTTLRLRSCPESPSWEVVELGFRPGRQDSRTHTSELPEVELCLSFTSVIGQVFWRQMLRWS